MLRIPAIALADTREEARAVYQQLMALRVMLPEEAAALAPIDASREPNLADAVGILRARGEVSEGTVERARRIAQAGDLNVHTWLMVLIDLGQLGPKDTAPSSSRPR